MALDSRLESGLLNRPVRKSGRASPPAVSRSEVSPERLLVIALTLMVALAALEGPVRLGLHELNLDALIFARDGALFIGLTLFLVNGTIERSLPAAIGIAAVMLFVHGLVSTLNFGTLLPAVYGFKIFLPAMCAFLVPAAIFKPGPTVVRLASVLWLASAGAAVYDQFTPGDMPWVGVKVELGGIEVSIGRDWQSTVKRVAGISRSSISLAVVLPLLSFMMLHSLRSTVVKVVVCACTMVVLVWTTQKGAILGYPLALMALLATHRSSTIVARALLVAAGILMVLAPTVLIHFDMPRDQGIFSFESLFERIEYMWPAAWDWINKFPPFLSAGLGGISGPQRFYAPNDINPADNMFVYMYANFGMFSVLYLAAVLLIALRARIRDLAVDGPALASMVFLLAYGIVVSLVEDQIASLWFGATLGWLVGMQPSAERALTTPLSRAFEARAR